MKKNGKNYLLDGRYLLKMAFKMKFIFLLVCVTSFQLPAKAFSQEVTIRMSNASFREVAKELERQTGIAFLFNDQKVSNIKNLDINFSGAELDQVLNKCLAGSGLSYKIIENTVIITPAAKLPATNVAVPQQKNTIKGKVTDPSGNGLPGVTILIKGTQIGVASDVNGNFSIELTSLNNQILVFSFIGMEKKEISVKDTKDLKVVMQEEAENMKEVVVTGIYQRKKESFTGSATTYTAKELKMIGNQNIIQSLKSLDPAFAVLENNEFGSDPNRLPDLEIRGKSSIVGLRDELSVDPNQPLFILDGFESTLRTIMDMDMDRVASITILKDAASTAIYGSKAANGVVVVETKKPEKGTLRVSYNGNFNISMPDLSSYNLMNSSEKLKFEKLAGRYNNDNGIEQTKLDLLYNKRQADVLSGVNTYWLAEPVKIGFDHRHSLYAEGGDDFMRYGIGITYNGIQGVMEESKREIFSGNLDLIYRKGQFLFSNKLTINYNNSSNPTVPFSDYAGANPYYKKENADGGIDKWLEYVKNVEEIANPLYNASLNSRSLGRSFGITNNFSAEYNPLSELKIRARFGLTKNIDESDLFTAPGHTKYIHTDRLKRGELSYNNSKSLQYEGEVTATYGIVLNERHRINAVAGANMYSLENVNNGYSVEGFPEGNYDSPAFSKGYPENGKPTYYDSRSRSVSFYMNGGYSYDDRYLFDVTYRVSGSSVFGTNKRYTNTWSTGLAWNLHNEAFIKGNVDWINLFKVRASIGNPGNQNFNAYQTITTYAFQNGQMNYFEPGVFLNSLGNPDLEWQKTKDRNVGMDLTFLGNRVGINIDYYNKLTDPLLVSIGVPSSVGVTTVMTNMGQQISQGWNGTLTISPIYRPQDRLIWSIRYNFRTEKAHYDKIGNKLDKFNENGRNKNLVRYFDGANPNALYAVRSAGIDPSTGKEIFYRKDGGYTFDFNFDDEVKVGVGRPKLEGVFGTSLTYKGFSCNFDFRYRCGGQAFNSAVFSKVENISQSGLQYNQDKRALYDRWKKPGDISKYKGISLTSSTQMSSRFVEDDNSLALESVRVGYEFDNDLIKNWKIKSLKLNAYMNDIFRVGSIKTERGIDYPFARSVSFSISAAF
ncbi:MAG: SusC/RagA family TonB-linked outer membrane protein [Odoribacter sp.]